MATDHEKSGRACIRRVLNGDAEAFREFIRLYENLVFSITARLIHDAEERNDICQDIFIKIYENLDSFRGTCRISSWVGKITTNTCLNVLRKKKALLPDPDISDYFGSLPDNGPLPDKQTETDDIRLRIHREIKRLPETYRIALTLFHLEGLRYQEIAEIMAIPENTVKSHLFRARQILKKNLLTVYHEEELTC